MNEKEGSKGGNEGRHAPVRVLIRFLSDMDEISKERIRFAENTMARSSIVESTRLKLRRLDNTTPLQYLGEQLTGPGEMPRMKLYNHLDVMAGLEIEHLNRLKTTMDRAGGVLSLKLLFYFAMSTNENLMNHDVFHYLQGVVSLFYQICVETPNVQIDAYKKIMKLAKQPHHKDNYPWLPQDFSKGISPDCICKFIKDNISDILLSQLEFSEYILCFQRYGNGILKVQEQQHEKKMDYASNKFIHYFANKTENTPKIQIPTRFFLQEERKKLYAVRVKTIMFYSRLNCLLIACEMSSQVQFYSVKFAKYMGTIDMESIMSSSTSKITSFTLNEDEHLLIVSTSDRAMFVISLDPYKKREYTDGQFDISVSSKTQMFFSPEIVISCVYVANCDVLAGITENSNAMLFWHGVKKEHNRPMELRNAPRFARYTGFESPLNPVTLKELESFGWVIIADTAHNLKIIDPVKNEMVLHARANVTMHTLVCDPLGHKIVAIGYEKVYWIYETSKYYREVRSVCFHKAHVSTIVAGEIIPRRRIFITCDDTYHVKSWDLDSLACIQNFRLSTTSPITRIAHIGYQGFIILSNMIYFLMFENHAENYLPITDDTSNIPQGDDLNDILVIPKLCIRASNDYNPEFYIGTSTEIRSFQVEDCLLSYRYNLQNLYPEDLKASVSAFEILDLPCSLLVVALESGVLIFTPTSSDESSKTRVVKNKEVSASNARVNHLLRNPRRPQLYVAHTSKVKLIEISRLFSHSH